MEQGLFFEICGWLASVTMILGYLPQAIYTIRTRDTDGIALPTFLMMGIVVPASCFRVYCISRVHFGRCSLLISLLRLVVLSFSALRSTTII